MARQMGMMDGNEAAAFVAHKINEVCAIYPITPSSNMGEWADEYSARGETNIWGTVPTIVEMQSEGGASGACHGALQTGALTTTFTASQGLLLMIPNMFKIAGELTSTVFHVAARSVATHALSIFGDHSDVMACRSTGWGMVASGSIQEVMDMTAITQAATLEARVPLVHFFDGFRSSHEVQKIEMLGEDDLKAMIDDELVRAHRARAMSPDRPVLRGTAQNPDVFFQAREACNPFYDAAPAILQKAMDKFASLTGRRYKLFDYYGAPDAEHVVMIMGSGGETALETVEALNAQGAKLGLIKVRVFRPFSIDAFVEALPETCKVLTALDRTKEPGGVGEPLYTDVVTALNERGKAVRVLGGRYGLSSKEFTPAMVKAVYDNMAAAEPKNHFTVGINDDVTHTSLDYDPDYSTEHEGMVQSVFFGLGSDGTVGANKNSIKIIGEETDNYAQGYFVYDSKKAGSVTVSHLRFGPEQIRSTYLITTADFVACHQASFLEKYDMLSCAKPGAVFLLNSPYGPDELWNTLPRKVQEDIIAKQIKFYAIDAYSVAKQSKMGARINTIMQTCFFAISGILPRDEAIDKIKGAIKKTYGRKGDDIVQMNYQAVDNSLENLHEIQVPTEATSTIELPPPVSDKAPEFVREVLGEIIAKRGDDLPVSAMPVDGTFPTATSRWEKRNIALEIPVWDADVCIQCGKCSMACPHASIRMKVYDPAELDGAPETFKSAEARGKDFKGLKCTIQVAPEDCTGCGACVYICPAKNKSEPKFKAINMGDQLPLREPEAENFDFFESIKGVDREALNLGSVKGSQLVQPLFEFSGACSGCGETPYLQLMTGLYGDRCLIANATGCSSIYGGNLPTVPFCTDAAGRGPTWSNSLFEDNAEFGLGFRITVDKHREYALELVDRMRDQLGADLADALIQADMSDEKGIREQRARVDQLKGKLTSIDSPEARNLQSVADMLVKKSVWLVGGDGWAYDIGYGGLDHALASGRNINVLVLDTGVYSNTGGQCSKATPRGAVAKFAAGGKPQPRKDLGMMAMTYGNCYVAQVAMGSSDLQTVKAFIEAESYDGPSLIIAYTHCIAHGINMRTGLGNQKQAVECGFWPLYRFDPRRAEAGQQPLQIDSKAPKGKVADWAYSETRFKMLTKSKPEAAAELIELTQADVSAKWHQLEQLAQMTVSGEVALDK